ncbi:hypothetical protein C8Q75DRAFT_773254 [Abortiporus biennis]|nr:hypothetical protein C8Q75DRAFT_773254 [Abortiporus biennis]
MSSPTPPPSVLSTIRTANFFQVSSDVLVMYDIMISFDQEVQRIWSQRWTGAKILFLINRYSAAARFFTGALTSWAPDTPHRCSISYDWYNISLIVSMTAAAFFGALRVWAIWGFWGSSRWVMSFFVLCVGLSVALLNLYRVTILRFVGGPIDTEVHICLSHLTEVVHGQKLQNFAIATRTLSIAADLVVLLATWAKTYQLRREAIQSGVRTNMFRLLVRDGTFNFLILLILNVLAIILDFSGPTFNPIPTFGTAMTSILISRLMLNLRGISTVTTDSTTRRGGDPNTTTATNLSSFRAADVAEVIFGTIGGPIEYRTDHADEDEGEDTSSSTARSTTGRNNHHNNNNDIHVPIERWINDPLSIGLIPQGNTSISDVEMKIPAETSMNSHQVSTVERFDELGVEEVSKDLEEGPSEKGSR